MVGEFSDQVAEMEAQDSRTCRKGWRRFVADVLSCFSLVGVALRRVFTWRRNEPEAFELQNEPIESVSVISAGASTNSSFDVRTLEDSYSAFHDFGETEFKSKNGRKPNSARGNASRKKDPTRDRICNPDGKYATISEEVIPTNIDVRERGEPNSNQKEEIPKSKLGFYPNSSEENGTALPRKAVKVEHKALVHRSENELATQHLDSLDVKLESLKGSKKSIESNAQRPDNLTRTPDQKPSKEPEVKKKIAESVVTVQNSENVVGLRVSDHELSRTSVEKAEAGPNHKRFTFRPSNLLKLKKSGYKNYPNGQSTGKDSEPKQQDLSQLKPRDEKPEANEGDPNPELIERPINHESTSNKTDASSKSDNQPSTERLDAKRKPVQEKTYKDHRDKTTDSSKAPINVNHPSSAKIETKPKDPRNQNHNHQKVNTESNAEAEDLKNPPQSEEKTIRLTSNPPSNQRKENVGAQPKLKDSTVTSKNFPSEEKAEDLRLSKKLQKSRMESQTVNKDSKGPISDDPSSSSNQKSKPKEKDEMTKDRSQAKPKESKFISDNQLSNLKETTKGEPQTKTNDSKAASQPKAEVESKASSNQHSNTKGKTKGETQVKTKPKAEAGLSASSNVQPNQTDREETEAKSDTQEIKFRIDPNIMPRMGDDLITMKFKMFQQLASIEQFEQHRAEEQGLPAGPKYPFSPQWLLDNPDEFMAIDATVEYPSQEEGSSEDETSPNTSKVESEDTKSYEDDFTSEDESEDNEDGDDDSYDDDEDDDDSDDGDDDSSSSTPRSSSDEQYSSSDDCRTTVEESQEKNLEAEQSHNDNLTPMHTNCACGKRSDTETSEENNGYEQNVVAQPWDYEEDVDEGEDQKEVSERNSTAPSDEVLSNQRRILKEGKGLKEEDVSERLIEMHKCWKRVKKIEVVSTKYPRRRSTSPVLPVQETLRVEEEQRIQREYEYDSETPVILRVAYGQKVYHLKLKNCTICSLEFDAFVPHQESLRTVGAAASKIPIRTKLSPVLPRHDRGYTKDDYVFGKGLSHLAYRYLRIVVKIHGKRLAIPIDLEKDRKMVRDFIRNPRSSLLTDPPGLGQFILDKAMAILQERPQWRFCGEHVDEQLKYHKWFSQCNASTETETSSPKTQDAASNVSFGSEGEEDHIEEQDDEEEEDQESDEEPEVQPARPQRMPLPEEEMQEPEPFTDDLYAERTEQLLAERAEKERKVKAVQQAGKSNHHVRKTFADKFTFIQEKYFCPNPSRRQFNERKYNIGFVPKNEKWIQVDVDADLAKEHIRKEDLIDAHAYPIQPENYDIGTYRMDECVAVQKAKKGHLESLGGKQKVKTRGIPNKHLEKHYFEKELKNLEKDEEENADEEETVFGNPEINEITEPKPIFVETGSPELDMRHIEDKPCKVLQKRPTAANPPTPSKNKNRKKRHRTTSGANPGAAIAPTNLAESLFDFSHSKPNRAKKR